MKLLYEFLVVENSRLFSVNENKERKVFAMTIVELAHFF